MDGGIWCAGSVTLGNIIGKTQKRTGRTIPCRQQQKETIIGFRTLEEICSNGGMDKQHRISNADMDRRNECETGGNSSENTEQINKNRLFEWLGSDGWIVKEQFVWRRMCKCNTQYSEKRTRLLWNSQKCISGCRGFAVPCTISYGRPFDEGKIIAQKNGEKVKKSGSI